MKYLPLLVFFLLFCHAQAEEHSTYTLENEKARGVAAALYRMGEYVDCKIEKNDPDSFRDTTIKECKIKNLICFANDLGAQLGEHPYDFVSSVSCRKDMNDGKNFYEWPELKNEDRVFALLLALEAAGVKPTGPVDGYGPEGFRAAQQYSIFNITCQMSGVLTCTVITDLAIE